jgi:hypothetical protein
MQPAQSYALGLGPYANQYGGIPSSMAMGAGGLAPSYMSPAQYSPYMQSPTGYWNQAANTGGSGQKVQQFSPQSAEKK